MEEACPKNGIRVFEYIYPGHLFPASTHPQHWTLLVSHMIGLCMPLLFCRLLLLPRMLSSFPSQTHFKISHLLCGNFTLCTFFSPQQNQPFSQSVENFWIELKQLCSHSTWSAELIDHEIKKQDLPSPLGQNVSRAGAESRSSWPQHLGQSLAKSRCS